ncbi:MAG TPA: EAL domain-containing protein [Steroidobacteraceae bacterium]|nr:EAL domain-containing protein [Steroidobacteraceae bacterium]
MRKKILWAACLAAMVLIVGVFYAARTVLSHSFASIEADEARQSSERVRQALQADLHQLDVAVEDYALWDDFYDFVKSGAREHIDHYFSRRGLDNIHVDVVWVVDDQGRTLLQLDTDAPAGGLTQLSPATLASLRSYTSLLRATPDTLKRPAQLVRMPLGAMAVAVRPINRDLRPAASAGTLVFGRYFRTGLIERLEQTSQSPVRATLLDERGRPLLSVPPAVGEWLASVGSGPDLLIQTGDPATLRTHALLRDVEGRPLVVLSTTVARAALQIGKRTITWVVAALLCGFALVVALLVSLLNRSWRSRAAAQRQWLDHQRKMSRLARRDALTGLPNRLHLQRLLPRLLARAARDGSRLALLNLDLDHFKNVNDSLGHGSGDRLLAAVAQRLRSVVAAHDIVVRMGGDEFVIVATLLPDAVIVDSIAERVRSAIAVPLDIDGVTLSVVPSIGISVYPEDGTDPEQLLKHADIALYTAKDRGRGNHQFYTPEMNARLRERLGLERALRQALDNNELFVEYQPCVDLQTLRTVSLEALIRWRTDDGTYIPPSRFIPIAEQSNLIVEIGAYVLRRVCLQLSEWQRERLPLVPVSVNISVRQFETTPLASVVSGLAQELGIDASLLHFEITESAAMQNSQQQLGSLQALRNLGSRILIDDFGTGYSSLSYLKHLPIDTLKIDRAFVRDMASDANDAAIVRAIVGVAKSLGLMLVAEGIESAEQLDCLRRLGCECGQGFFFSPSVSAEDCRNMLWQLRGPRASLEAPKLRLLNPVN